MGKISMLDFFKYILEEVIIGFLEKIIYGEYYLFIIIWDFIFFLPSLWLILIFINLSKHKLMLFIRTFTITLLVKFLLNNFFIIFQINKFCTVWINFWTNYTKNMFKEENCIKFSNSQNTYLFFKNVKIRIK